MTLTLSTPTSAVAALHQGGFSALKTPTRLLLGPGPSNADPAVLAATSLEPIGHLDPAYLKLMDEV